jgi:hypothetical protein
MMKATRILLACTIVFVLLASGLSCTSGRCVGYICTYEGKQPPYTRSETDRGKIHLVENPNAVDPTWQQLEAFLIADNTDKEAYDLETHPCGVFAEELQNNAEAAGIRAAWVAIDFVGGGDGHALDAFNTTDKGLVFIDCTGGSNSSDVAQPQQGESWGKADDWDKVAYLSIGQEYGLISLSVAVCPEYECYEAYKQQKADFDAALDEYNQAMDAHNADVQNYNNWIWGKTFHPGTADYQKAQDWYNNIQSEKRELYARLQALNKEGGALVAFWEPLGNVSHINIYW